MNALEGQSAQLPAAITLADIDTVSDGEPRILDLRLASALGFKKPRDIRPLIERHREPLERLGGFCRTVRQNRGRGRPGTEYRLNKKQALYICTKSDTDRATDITIQIVEVFDAVTEQAAKQVPHLPPPSALPSPDSDRPAVPESLAADLLEGADQIAAFMGLSPRQVYHLQGHLPVFTIGAKLFARKSTIVQWIAEQERRPFGKERLMEPPS